MDTENQFSGKTYVGSDELYADVQRSMALVAEMTPATKPKARCVNFCAKSRVLKLTKALEFFRRLISIMAN